MVVKRIKALTDIDLSTSVQSVFLVEGQVELVAFKNEGEFKALLEFGNFEEVSMTGFDYSGLDIPVIRNEGIPKEDLMGRVDEISRE